MKTVNLNQPVPDFTLPSTEGGSFTLSQNKGKNIVLYFYPKDDTPGCTQEGKDFSANVESFAKHNTIIIGISRDKMASHQKFKCKYGFGFELLSDENEQVCKIFDVIIKKNMFSKIVFGIERSTFLIDKNGILKQAWRKVSVKDHVNEVLEAVKTLA